MQYELPNTTYGGSWDTTLKTGIDTLKFKGWLPPGPSVTSGSIGPIVTSGSTATVYMNGVHSSLAGSWQLFAARSTGTLNYNSGSPLLSGWQNQLINLTEPVSGFIRGTYTFSLTSGFGSQPAVVTGPKGYEQTKGVQIYCTGHTRTYIDFITLTTTPQGALNIIDVVSQPFSFAVFDW